MGGSFGFGVQLPEGIYPIPAQRLDVRFGLVGVEVPADDRRAACDAWMETASYLAICFVAAQACAAGLTDVRAGAAGDLAAGSASSFALK